MYLISAPFLYLSKFVNVCFHWFAWFRVTESFLTPSAYKSILAELAAFPTHFLLTETFVFSVVCVFFIFKPLISAVYPATASSVTVYLISLRWLSYLGRFLKLYSHLPVASAVTSFVCILLPFERRLTVILFGRLPSLLLASSQVFSPETSVVLFIQ